MCSLPMYFKQRVKYELKTQIQPASICIFIEMETFLPVNTTNHEVCTTYYTETMMGVNHMVQNYAYSSQLIM